MRLFVAIEFPTPVREALARMQERLRTSLHGVGVSWTRPENLHLTLKFIGEWPEPQVAELCESLREARTASIELSLAGAATLPPRGAARVLVVELAGELERLVELAGQIDNRCHAVGVPREARKYRPHVTLGRPRPPRKISADLLRNASATADALRFCVHEFVLMQSQLSPKGSTYTRLARFPLE